MHVGLAQISIKTFLKKAVNSPIFMALRDKRLRRYKTCIVAMIQTNIHNGPVMFECFLDFCIDLTSAKTLETLKLGVYLQGDEFT